MFSFKQEMDRAGNGATEQSSCDDCPSLYEAIDAFEQCGLATQAFAENVSQHNLHTARDEQPA